MEDPKQLLFCAVLGQVALTIILYLLLVRSRFAAANDPTLDRKRLAYDQGAWPMRSRLISNSVTSQFELPVLFYVGVLFAFQLERADKTLAILAVIFVVLRVIHALIHTTHNVVLHRFGAFLLGFITLIVFWCILAVRMLGLA